DERLRQAFNRDALQMLSHAARQAHAGKKTAAAEVKVEQAEYAALGKREREFFQFPQLARQIAATDQRADGGAGNHLDRDLRLIKCFQHTDMRPAARSTAAKG